MSYPGKDKANVLRLGSDWFVMSFKFLILLIVKAKMLLVMLLVSAF